MLARIQRNTVAIPKGVLITGTDTDAGKTLFTSALLHAVHNSLGVTTAGFKPVASGLQPNEAGKLVNPDIEYLSRSSSLRLEAEDMCPYQFDTACAPHIAAELDNIEIDEERIFHAATKLFNIADFVAVEGAGGFTVPLRLPHRQDAGYGLDDVFSTLANQHNIGVIVVVGMRLGCINHARLTVQAIQAKGIPVVGWVANCLYSQGALIESNIATLDALLPCERLATIPHIKGKDSVQQKIQATANHLNANLILQRISRVVSATSAVQITG